MEILEHDMNQTRIIIKYIRTPRIGDSFKYQCLSSLGLYTPHTQDGKSTLPELWDLSMTQLEFQKLGYMHAKSLQSCSTLWDPKDCSLPDTSVHGILQARMLEWVAIPYSRGSSWPKDQTHISLSPALAGEFFTTRETWETTRVTWETPCLIQRITVSPFVLKVGEARDMKVVLTGETHQHRHKKTL